LGSSHEVVTGIQKAIPKARGKGLQVKVETIRIVLEIVEKKILHAGPVVRWGIDQRIRNVKQSRGPFMRMPLKERDTVQVPRKMESNRRQRNQFANSIKIQGNASLEPSASLLMIRVTDLILRA
jgi:hypothetical protein